MREQIKIWQLAILVELVEFSCHAIEFLLSSLGGGRNSYEKQVQSKNQKKISYKSGQNGQSPVTRDCAQANQLTGRVAKGRM